MWIPALSQCTEPRIACRQPLHACSQASLAAATAPPTLPLVPATWMTLSFWTASSMPRRCAGGGAAAQLQPLSWGRAWQQHHPPPAHLQVDWHVLVRIPPRPAVRTRLVLDKAAQNVQQPVPGVGGCIGDAGCLRRQGAPIRGGGGGSHAPCPMQLVGKPPRQPAQPHAAAAGARALMPAAACAHVRLAKSEVQLFGCHDDLTAGHAGIAAGRRVVTTASSDVATNIRVPPANTHLMQRPCVDFSMPAS